MRYFLLLVIVVLAVVLSRIGSDLVASGKLKKKPRLSDNVAFAPKSAANFQNSGGIRPPRTTGLGPSNGLTEPTIK